MKRRKSVRRKSVRRKSVRRKTYRRKTYRRKNKRSRRKTYRKKRRNRKNVQRGGMEGSAPPPQAFYLGQKVARRNGTGAWGVGFVTSIDPLYVTVSDKDASEEGHKWDEVRQFLPREVAASRRRPAALPTQPSSSASSIVSDQGVLSQQEAALGRGHWHGGSDQSVPDTQEETPLSRQIGVAGDVSIWDEPTAPAPAPAPAPASAGERMKKWGKDTLRKFVRDTEAASLPAPGPVPASTPDDYLQLSQQDAAYASYHAAPAPAPAPAPEPASR